MIIHLADTISSIEFEEDKKVVELEKRVRQLEESNQKILEWLDNNN